MNKSLNQIVVIGDRVLIEPSNASERTRGGLYLPANYQEKDDIQSGYILKCGPGYAIPNNDEEEDWQPQHSTVRYMPLQVKAGDLAIFLRKQAIEVKIDGKKYFIVPQHAILVVERNDFDE